MASNCTREEYEQRVRELLAMREGKCAEISSVAPLSLKTDCVHAIDTGESNPNCKCRGTKIICQNSSGPGMNYSKYCNAANCKLYQKPNKETT